MKSIQCRGCGRTNWAQAQACKWCGFVLTETSQYRYRQDFNPGSFGDDRYIEVGRSGPGRSSSPMSSSTGLKTGLAIASMVLGIICIPTSLVLIGVVLAPVGLILGIVALVQASKNPHVYGGKGFAIAGVTLSSLALVLVVPIIAAIAIPNVIASKRAADEGSAIRSLRTLHAAQMTYQATSGAGFYGDLSSLRRAGLIDDMLSTGEKNSYRYEVSVTNAGRKFDVYATPISRTGGGRSFMITEDGVIRGGKHNGARAERDDAPLGN